LTLVAVVVVVVVDADDDDVVAAAPFAMGLLDNTGDLGPFVEVMGLIRRAPMGERLRVRALLSSMGSESSSSSSSMCCSLTGWGVGRRFRAAERVK
jgi:hypothetical protein